MSSTVNQAAAVDVVAVVRREADFRRLFARNRRDEEIAGEFHAAAEAIAELIAADVELDELLAGFKVEGNTFRRCAEQSALIEVAKKRRSAALAAIRSGGGSV